MPAKARVVSKGKAPVVPEREASSQGHIYHVLKDVFEKYNSSTDRNLRFIDSFLAFLVVTGVLQFLYCALVTDFPFNAFIGGFAACVGQFVLAASLRLQVDPAHASTFKVTPKRAFGEFVAASLILHFFVFNYLG